MKKHNYLIIIFKKLNLLINSLLKNNLNKLKFNNLKNIKRELLISKKVFLTIILLTILCLFYLSIPFFYDKTKIQNVLKNQLYQKFGINFILSNNLNYSFFPRPHFVFENSSIFEKKVKLSDVGRFKIFISLENFFSLKKINIKNIILENSNFNLNKKNVYFFTNLLDNEFLDSSIIIKDSNIFYRNFEGAVLFVNKIENIKYYDNPKNSFSILKAYNEIFNIPYSIELQNDKINKKLFLKMKSKVIKFKIENELDYSKDIKIGLLNYFNGNNKNITSYELKKNSLHFVSTKKKSNRYKFYSGLVNFEPFFLNADVNINELYLTYLFDSNSLFLELLKAEIFDNKNLNIEIDINSKKIIHNDRFVDFLLKFTINDGLINIDTSKVNWSDFVNFQISDSLFYIDNDGLFLSGKVSSTIENLGEIYKFYRTPKKFRTEINKLEFNFNYNLDQQMINFNNIKINNKINKNFATFFNKSIPKKSFQNQIYFKKFINKILKIYAG